MEEDCHKGGEAGDYKGRRKEIAEKKRKKEERKTGRRSEQGRGVAVRDVEKKRSYHNLKEWGELGHRGK